MKRNAIPGFPNFATLQRQVRRSWRSQNRRRWGRTFWREAKHRCGDNPELWLEWLLDMEAEFIMGGAGPTMVLSLVTLSPDRWQHLYRHQIIQRILNDPWGLQRLRDEYQELYSNGESNRILELEGITGKRPALIAAA